MKHFTEYATRIRPNGSQRRKVQAVITKKKTGKPGYKLQVSGFKKVVERDKTNFKIGQKAKAVAILKVLRLAHKKKMATPNIDEICRIAKVFYERKHPNRNGNRKNFREVFNTLIAAGYVKKV